MPTYNRRTFVGQAIWYFLRQDYPSRELIIVDDGSDQVSDLIPNDERIHYIRLESPSTVAAKRELAYQTAHGGFIAYWDDDDWQSPRRLSVQVEHMLNSGASICGIGHPLCYHLTAGQAWLPESPLYRVHEGTLIYRRDGWSAHKHTMQALPNGQLLAASLNGANLLLVEDRSLYVVLYHGHNGRTPSPQPPHWISRPVSEVTSLLRYDLDFYVSLRNGGAVGQQTSINPVAPSVTLSAPFLVYDGYGIMAEYLALGMARDGVKVNIDPLTIDWSGLSDEFRSLFSTTRTDPTAPVVFFHPPIPELARYRRHKNLFINTMWESNRLPKEWANRINWARVAIVPTRFVARVFRDNGVVVPIVVVPEGIAPEVYSYQERPEREGITTLIVGPVVDRKHTLEAISAWKEAFAGDPEARLIVKARFNHANYIPDDPRIRIIDGNETTRGIAHWYRQADVLLALGSEGFGLPLVEGMATGLPVIALNSEGQADMCHDAAGNLLPVEPARYERYEDSPFGECGVYGVPDVEQAAAHLRWVNTHRAEARAMGKAASEWVRQNRNIWAKGPAVLDILERYASPPKVLRRLPTFLVPSWGQECGVAEYTAHLTRHLNAARVVSRFDGAQPIRLLHIQNKDRLFQHGHVLRAIRSARETGVPAIVTVHWVQRWISAWERDADAFVALTTPSAGSLRQRWPSKPIYHIPIGCPTWFPPRKRTRGRVIGVFGFLGSHKGFWALLEAIKQLPDTSVLMLSFAKSDELLSAWKRDSAGLPIRHINRYLPEAEVATRLAAEADILVYWYDEISPEFAASAAVRVGLASGVPVLASPTSWFHDLRDVTYQPDDLRQGVERLLEDTQLRQRLAQAAYDYCHTHTWEHIAGQHRELWQEVCN
jgi:glycosyltransferase involved in cell wall biosynthesis